MKGKFRFLKSAGGRAVLLFGVLAAAVSLLALLYLRYFYVPPAPPASRAMLYVDASGAACLVCDRQSVAVLSPGRDPSGQIDFLSSFQSRYDLVILPSLDEDTLLGAKRLLSRVDAKTVIIPRGMSGDAFDSLREAAGSAVVKRMPYKKAVVAGEVMLYDQGEKDAMALSLFHGSRRILFAASPCGGSFSAAFCSEVAASSSTFSCDGEVFVLGTVPDKTSIRALSISPLSEDLTVYLSGQ